MLGRIRAALADDGPAHAVPARLHPPRAARPGQRAVIELLVDRLVDYKALVRRSHRRPSSARRIGRGAVRHAESVVIAPGLDRPTIAEACAGRRPHRHHRRVTRNPVARRNSTRIDAVVTTARVAIALSGTIILDGGPGQGRRAITLVPDRHVVVLTAEQVVETVAGGHRAARTHRARSP